MELEALFEDGEDRLRVLPQELLRRRILEQEMTKAPAAAPG